MSLKLSEEEQKKIRNLAKSELERLELIESDSETTKLVDEFKRKFNMCEVIYKVVLKKHQNDINNNTTDIFRLIISQVKPAMEYAGYKYDDTLMRQLFSTNTKVGERTVKSIRDALTHKMSNSAIDELKSRKEELFKYMNDFIEMVRNFD
ncbi:MAG: hypothetical protein K6E20_00005 [Acholeplasmatales bacterium]|nr:hypothetical protein [Acholeplasmatales bacterium]